MQRDFFLSTLINDRAHPMVALPPGVIVERADLTTLEPFRSYRCGDVSALDLPTLCKRLVAVGCNATHLQVYDATDGHRVPMTFMSIAETAAFKWPPLGQPNAGVQPATEPAAIPAAGSGVVT